MLIRKRKLVGRYGSSGGVKDAEADADVTV